MPGGEAQELPEVIRALIMGSRSAGATLFRSSMANEKRLRQSILRDAIRENVDVIEGRLPKGLRRTRSERRRPLGSRPSMTSTFSRIASLRIDCRSRFSLAMELRKRVAPADLLPMMR